jgi:hypothetical protein
MDGPSFQFGPPCYSCRQGCARVFGSYFWMYHCSTSPTSITYTGYYDEYGAGGGVRGEDESNCYYYSTTGARSSYVMDHTNRSVNYCFPAEPQ